MNIYATGLLIVPFLIAVICLVGVEISWHRDAKRREREAAARSLKHAQRDWRKQNPGR